MGRGYASRYIQEGMDIGRWMGVYIGRCTGGCEQGAGVHVRGYAASRYIDKWDACKWTWVFVCTAGM